MEGPAQNPTVVGSKVQLRGKRMTNGLPTGGHPRVMQATGSVLATFWKFMKSTGGREGDGLRGGLSD